MVNTLLRESIRTAVIKHPDLSYEHIATQFDVGRMTVITIAKEAGVKRKRGSAAEAFRATIARSVSHE